MMQQMIDVVVYEISYWYKIVFIEINYFKFVGKTVHATKIFLPPNIVMAKKSMFLHHCIFTLTIACNALIKYGILIKGMEIFFLHIVVPD